MLHTDTALPWGSADGDLGEAAMGLFSGAPYRNTSFTRTPILRQTKSPCTQYLDFDSHHKWVLKEEK